MRNVLLLLLMVSVVSVFMSPVSVCYSYECARKGDTMTTVLNRCGEPTWVDTREERRRGMIPYGTVIDGWYIVKRPMVGEVTVQIEEWTYNLGRTRFMRIFTFENGILTGVTTGGYGY